MSAKFQLTVWRHAKQALAAGDSDSLEQLGFTPDMVDVLQRSSDAQLQVLAEQNPTRSSFTLTWNPPNWLQRGGASILAPVRPSSTRFSTAFLRPNSLNLRTNNPLYISFEPIPVTLACNHPFPLGIGPLPFSRHSGSFRHPLCSTTLLFSVSPNQ